MWVLMVIVTSYYGAALHTQEFETKAACIWAGNHIPKTMHHVSAVCVPKGNVKPETTP